MPRTLASATDLGALHDALGCAAMAAVQAWRGNQDSAALSLAEAHAAAEEAFGCGSPEVEALSVVLVAIAQAAGPPCDHPTNDRPRCANTAADLGPIPLRTGEDLEN
jgi:hypothetical protein